jgi:hypothetical protein
LVIEHFHRWNIGCTIANINHIFKQNRAFFWWCVFVNAGTKTKAQELLQNNRANYIAKADYSNGSEIDQIVKSILDQISLKASVKQNRAFFWWCVFINAGIIPSIFDALVNAK